MPAAAVIQVCVDPRLNHELISLQVRQKIERSGVRADWIYVVNDIGGNPGASFRNTLQLIHRAGEAVVFSALLHHDDCLAEKQGQRVELALAAQQMREELGRIGSHAPVFTGHIRTEHNHVLWADEPELRYAPFSFGAITY